MCNSTYAKGKEILGLTSSNNNATLQWTTLSKNSFQKSKIDNIYLSKKKKG